MLSFDSTTFMLTSILLRLIILLFKWLRSVTNENYLMSGGITAIICMSIAVTALYFKKESYGKDLNFVEV